MQMERVLARITVVENNLDNLAFLKDIRIRISTVDRGICGRLARRENGV